VSRSRAEMSQWQHDSPWLQFIIKVALQSARSQTSLSHCYSLMMSRS